MYDYTYDLYTGGLLLNNGTPTSSKEPRPVYATEMLMLHMDDMFAFDPQTDRPYLWAESASYFYRGQLIARTKGGSLCKTPVMDYHVLTNADGEKVTALPRGSELEPIDIEAMVRKNADMMAVIEQSTVKKIYGYYQRYKNKLDCFHVAFSGGKDSVVLLELVKKALPKDAFMVVFGDTNMEFPDTYTLVDVAEQQCNEDGIAFYRASSHLDPQDSWRIFGPPSRVLRWCCSVHKAAPQTLKIREVIRETLGKDDYVGADLVGVRAAESQRRSEYEAENFGKKQKGQYAFYPILDWTSAEIWMYTYSRSLPINEAYKKGNTRAGCLFCPMGGGKSDSFRIMSYPTEIESYMDIIRTTINDNNMDSYISNGGWTSRRNGRDLVDNPSRYYEEEREGKLYITVIEPSANWREWIKTLGALHFEFGIEEKEDGYIVRIPAQHNKTTLGKQFKQVFRKAAYCVGCRVCEANCPSGCISFNSGLHISNCRHCGHCHEIDEGCLVYHALEQPKNGGYGMKSLNSFADHAPKPSWVFDFFDNGNEFFNTHTLGPMQISIFKKFLTNAELVSKNKVTPFFDLIIKIGSSSEAAWGLIYTQLAYNNAQIRWYIDNMPIDAPCARAMLEDQLMADDVSEKDARSIMKAYKRLCEIPLGTVMHMGTTSGKSVDSLTRTKCSMRDDRVLLYVLYRYAGACGDYYEFSLSRLMDTTIGSAGISPVKLFGYSEDEMVAMLSGLSSKYPELIHVTFTHGLDKVSLREEKTAADVLKLF